MKNIDWSNLNSSLIIEVTRPEGIFTSSAVAISSDLVLTAAHCLEGEILKVRVFNQSSYDPQSKFWEISAFELHPNYNKTSSNFNSDLARIKLKEKLPTETIFYPILKDEYDLSGQMIRVGFGTRTNQNIRTMVTPVFKELHYHNNVLELNDMYSYSGDSGGPVFVQRNGQMYLVAIHSTLSYGPQGKFSYNPLLSSQRPWIHAAWN